MKKVTVVIGQDGDILNVYAAPKSKVRAAIIASEIQEVGGDDGESRSEIIRRVDDMMILSEFKLEQIDDI